MTQSLTAFKETYEKAEPFVRYYEKRQLQAQAQLQYRSSSECSPAEAIVINEWLVNNSKWLMANEVEYNKCIALLALPKADIKQLYEAYEALYGGKDKSSESAKHPSL